MAYIPIGDTDFKNLESVVAYAESLANHFEDVRYIIRHAGTNYYNVTANPIDSDITIIWSSDKGFWGRRV